MSWSDAILTKEDREAGFYLEEDENFLYLRRGGISLTFWSSAGATVQEVQAEIQRIREIRCRKCNRPWFTGEDRRELFRDGMCYPCYQAELDARADRGEMSREAADLWRILGTGSE